MGEIDVYLLQVGPIVYGGFRDGRPFSLADCWREAEGVGHARILDARGRIVLDRAGDQVGRRERVRMMRAAHRRAVRLSGRAVYDVRGGE